MTRPFSHEPVARMPRVARHICAAAQIRPPVRGSAISLLKSTGECPVPEPNGRVVRGSILEYHDPLMKFWYVYVLRSAKDSQFYVGSTNDVRRRLQQHQRGENVSTAKRLPVELLYFEGHTSQEDALRREKYLKSTKGRTTLRQILRAALQLPTWARARAASGAQIVDPDHQER